MIDLKNYIINRFRTLNPELDFSEGSVLRDVLLEPLAQILQSYQSDHETVLSKLTLSDVAQMSEEELDAIATNFLITRNQGDIAIGKIKLYFNSPTSITIPANTRFTTSSGVAVETISNYTITRGDMELNIEEFPLYNTDEINVHSINTGEDANLEIGTPLNLQSSLSTTPSRAEVSEELTGGLDHETNEQFYLRLLNTVFNKTLASSAAIRDKIMSHLPSVRDVEVVGAGHPLMIRDLTDFYEGNGDYVEENFEYVFTDRQELDYSKKHLAQYGLFLNEDSTGGVHIPPPAEFEDEFTDDMYQGLFFADDVKYANVDQYALVNEDFDSSREDLIRSE
jgi:hypothetical protein